MQAVVFTFRWISKSLEFTLSGFDLLSRRKAPDRRSFPAVENLFVPGKLYRLLPFGFNGTDDVTPIAFLNQTRKLVSYNNRDHDTQS
jgi:hypothetical protein